MSHIDKLAKKLHVPKWIKEDVQLKLKEELKKRNQVITKNCVLLGEPVA